MGLLFNICNIYILPVDFEVLLTISRCREGGLLTCSLSSVYTKCQYMCSMHKMYMCVCMHVCLDG